MLLPWIFVFVERAPVRDFVTCMPDSMPKITLSFGPPTVVLVAPASQAQPASLDPYDLLKEFDPTQRLAIGDPAHVPAGLYARDALRGLGLWDALAPHCALAENVRAALALVARGEAPFGIVYATDALLENDVVIVAQFAQMPQAISYSFALHQAASPDAYSVFDDLTSASAVARFVEAGFSKL